LSLKQPVQEYIVLHLDQQYIDDILSLENYVKGELNCKELKCINKIQDYVKLSAEPNQRLLGARLKSKMGVVRNAVRSLSHEKILEFLQTGKTTVEGELLQGEELAIKQEFVGDKKTYEAVIAGDAMVLLNFVLNDQLKNEGIC